MDDEFDFAFDEEDSDDDIPDFGRMGVIWRYLGLLFVKNYMVYILFLINVEYMFEKLFLHPKTSEFLKIFAFDDSNFWVWTITKKQFYLTFI